MSNLEKGVDKIKNFGQNTIKKIVEQPNDIFFSIVILCLSFLIIFIIVLYIIKQVTKRQDNINYINRNYKIYQANIDEKNGSKPYISIKTINDGLNRDYNYPTKQGKVDGLLSTGRICDYFIAGSYNSCCSGDFKNDYVDIEALKNVIRSGARVLDFQLFYINDNVIVAASSDETEFIKGTYNYLYLSGKGGVLDIINTYAFSQAEVTNFQDPLFINLRIQSERMEIYDKLTTMFTLLLGDRLLTGSGYGYDGTLSGLNINDENIQNFNEKVIIMCDQKNKNYLNTSFYELINLTSNRDDGALVTYRNYEVNFAEESDSIIDKSKRKIVMVYPDNSDINDNKDPANLFNLGCSIILMNYQKLDSNLIKYLNTFGQPQEYSGIDWQPSAFMLKKESLRDKVNITKNDDKPCNHPDVTKYIIDITTDSYCYRTTILKNDPNLTMNKISGLFVDDDYYKEFNVKTIDTTNRSNYNQSDNIQAYIYDGSKNFDAVTSNSKLNRCDAKLGHPDIYDLPQIGSRDTTIDERGCYILKISEDDNENQDILIYDQENNEGNYLNAKIGKHLKSKTWRIYKR